MGSDPRFVDQKKRILFLWLSAPFVLLSALFTQSAWMDDFFVGDLIEQVGVILVFACIVGRCWAALHIGGRKNAELVQSGPYRYSRNPLYFFSCLGLAGMGFLLESVVLGLLLFSFGYLAFQPVLKREAKHLHHLFGSEYGTYAQQVSEFFPAPSDRPPSIAKDRLNYSQSVLRRTFLDACYFLLIFPLIEVVDWLHDGSWISPTVFLY